MEDNSELIQRFMTVLSAHNVTVNAAAKLFGLTQSTIFSQLQRGRLQLNVIQGVIKTWPEVSPDWLLLGVGDMTRTTADQLRTTDQYYALVDSMADLQKKHETEMLELIKNNQRSGGVNISNVGNTTINNKA